MAPTVMNQAFARQVRLQRLFRYGDERLFVVPLDHSLTDGPITNTSRGLEMLVRQLSYNGVDGVVLHKGTIRHLDPGSLTRTSLILHMSASTAHAGDPDAKYLVANVEEAVRAGADAVSVHVNLGSRDEGGQIFDLASVAESCDRWNMPLLVMIYPRGPQISNPKDPALVAHAASLAADLGADIVKTPYVGNPEEMADVVRGCPIPLVVAGGPRLDDPSAVIDYVDEVLSAGVAGLAMGRNVFQTPDPGALARQIHERLHLHEPMPVEATRAALKMATS